MAIDAGPDPAGIEALAALLLKPSSRRSSPATTSRERAASRRWWRWPSDRRPVWFEGLRHHAPSRPAIRATGSRCPSTPGMRQALGDTDLVLLVGGPFFEEVWFAPGGHFPTACRLLQIEASAGRLALNNRLDAGIVGDIAASLARAGGSAARKGERGLQQAAQQPQRRAGRMQAQDKEAHARASRRLVPRSRSRCRASWPRSPRAARQRRHRRRDHHRQPRPCARLPLRGFGDYFGGRGGGIGQGLAGAIGVKVAMPDRPVVAVSGDGSAMYASRRCGPPRTTTLRSCS